MTTISLKRAGWILIIAGLVGVGITAVDLNGIYTSETNDSAPALAEAISGTLAPATVGFLLVLVGVVLVLRAWWRTRRTKQTTAVQSA
ncbi:MAG: hypothetical protein P8R37_09065 [Opitutae bacterium]|nr:hypothetical protein [Opitutae bacterium]